MVKKTKRWPRSGENDGVCIEGYTAVCTNYKCLVYDADRLYDASEEQAVGRWETRVE